jgi:hypothetical protein
VQNRRRRGHLPVRARACISISVQQQAERARTDLVLQRVDPLLQLDDLDAVVVHDGSGFVDLGLDGGCLPRIGNDD